MLRLFERQRYRPTLAERRQVRLSLEALETRDCPSTTTPPGINLSATVSPNHNVQLSGTVTDDNPAGLTIAFSGAASGSTTTDGTGHYSWTTQNARLGSVSAGTVDRQGNSLTASSTIAVAPPTLTLSISYGAQRWVTLSGTVTDIDPGGRVVTFTGVVSSTVTTNADGTYSLTVQASGLGNVQATTVDLWYQSSNTAQVTVSVAAPVISNFNASEGQGNVWTFSGRVTAPSAPGMTVTLGGIPSLQGVTAVVQADGTFSVQVTLQAGEMGTATAQILSDWWGQSSNIAWTPVQPT